MTLQMKIQTQSDLEQAWRTLMGPLGFGGHSVWLVLLEPDGTTTPMIMEITESEEPLDESMQTSLAELLRLLTTETVPDGRVAFLRTRPGRDGVSAADRRWATALYAACRLAGVRHEVVHVANDVMLHPVPLDALGSAA
ncbi:hypothetical protein [Nocardioides psychrotolerans]|uniref:hypothetical protein n=1 Tax=Nocardioides psychrotolerans TaxID=1005945 RepID=UPI0031380C80